jgi:hypothetical protein
MSDEQRATGCALAQCEYKALIRGLIAEIHDTAADLTVPLREQYQRFLEQVADIELELDMEELTVQ